MDFEPRFLYLEMKGGLEDPLHSLLQNIVPGVLTSYQPPFTSPNYLPKVMVLSSDHMGNARKECDRSHTALPKVTAAWYSHPFRTSRVQGHSPVTMEKRETLRQSAMRYHRKSFGFQSEVLGSGPALALSSFEPQFVIDKIRIVPACLTCMLS